MTIDIQTITQHAHRMVRVEQQNAFHQNKAKNTICLFKTGDYLEAYEESATILNSTLGLPIEKSGNIICSGFTKRESDRYFPVLVRKGYKIAIFD
jgi:DNA mismatch repair ATPase MutS